MMYLFVVSFYILSVGVSKIYFQAFLSTFCIFPKYQGMNQGENQVDVLSLGVGSRGSRGDQGGISRGDLII